MSLVAWIRSNGEGAALLDMAEDRAADVEQPVALVVEERLDEARRVQRVGAFAADHEAEPFAAGEARPQRLEVLLRRSSVMPSSGR